MFAGIVQDLDVSAVFCVLDGLDECDEDSSRRHALKSWRQYALFQEVFLHSTTERYFRFSLLRNRLVP